MLRIIYNHSMIKRILIFNIKTTVAVKLMHGFDKPT